MQVFGLQNVQFLKFLLKSTKKLTFSVPSRTKLAIFFAYVPKKQYLCGQKII